MVVVPHWVEHRGSTQADGACKRRGGLRWWYRTVLCMPWRVDDDVDESCAGRRGRRRRQRAALPLLRRAAAPHFRRPRLLPAVRELPHRRRAQPHGALLPAARARLRALLPGAARAVRRAGGDLHRVRLLLVLLGLLGGARG